MCVKLLTGSYGGGSSMNGERLIGAVFDSISV